MQTVEPPPRDPLPDIIPWGRPKPRNIARGVITVIVVALSLTSILALNWMRDNDSTKGSRWKMTGGRLINGEFYPYDNLAANFCEYVKTSRETTNSTNPYFQYYPPGGLVDIDELCDSLKTFGGFTGPITWSCVGVTGVWALLTIYLAVNGPWLIADRMLLSIIMLFNAILCTALLTLVTVWISHIRQKVTSSGIYLSSDLGIYGAYFAYSIAAGSVLLMALDIFFVVGYNTLPQHKWLSYDAEQEAAKQAAYAAEQQRKNQEWGIPMGALYAPGEVFAQPRVAPMPQKPPPNFTPSAARVAWWGSE